MRNKVLPLKLSLAAMLVLAACAPAAVPGRQDEKIGGPTQAATPQRTLVVVVRGEPPSIAAKPVVAFSGALSTPVAIFNATLDYRDHRSIPHAHLAEALPQLNTSTWRVFPDGRMETSYKLKANLTWHDGMAFSAEDFVFAWRVYATPQLGQATSPPIGQMEEVVAPDPKTLLIRWRQPFPEADVLTNGFQALPRHILQEPFASLDPVAFAGLSFWTSEYIGLGPFRVDRWEPGAFIEGAAFDRFVLGRPKIDRITVRFIPDPQTAVANLLAGEVHFVSDFVFSVTEGQTLEQQFAQHGGGTVLYSPVSLRSSVVQLRPEQVETPALLDVRVRKAVAFGMDSTTAVEVLTAGKSPLTNTLTSPRVPYYAEIERVIQKYSYDPRRSQQLMEEAGFSRGPDGFFVGRDGQPVRFSVASSSGTKNEAEAATYVDSLRRAGLDATQRVVPAAQINDPEGRALLPGLQIRGGANALRTYTSEQIPRPENRWRGENRGGWSNPEFDRVFEAWTGTLGEPERIRLIAQMERILTEEAPVIPHFFGAETNAHVAALQGPSAREVPDSGGPFLFVPRWEWRW